MVREFIQRIADKVGLKLTNISIEDSKPLGCADALVVKIASGTCATSTIIFKSELDELRKNGHDYFFMQRVTYSLSQLSTS